MSENMDNELTKSQKLICNIAAGVIIVLAGIFMLLVGLGVMPTLTLANSALWLSFTAIALIFIFTAIVQKNSLSMFLSMCFFIPALVTIIANFSVATYAQLYPLYIATPAIGALFAMIFSSEYKSLLKAALFFGVIALIFTLQSTGLVGFAVIVPILVVCLGLLIVLWAINNKKVANEDENE